MERTRITQQLIVFFILMAGVLFFILFHFFRRYIDGVIEREKNERMVTVVTMEQRVKVKALYDTGNQLKNPYTGESVHVISEVLAVRLQLRNSPPVCLIPYHSVGGNGLLEAYRLTQLILENGTCQKQVMVAVSQVLCQDKEIQMILNIT